MSEFRQSDERCFGVAIATKRCQLRQSEVGLFRYNVLQEDNKKASATWAEAW